MLTYCDYWVDLARRQGALVVLEYLAELIPVLTKDRRRVLLMGDFNINLMNLHSHEPTQNFLNILTSSFFAPAINCPTRVTEETATLIYNIFTKFYQEVYMTLLL